MLLWLLEHTDSRCFTYFLILQGRGQVQAFAWTHHIELTRRGKQRRDRELLAPVGSREEMGTGVQQPILQQLPFTEHEVISSHSIPSTCCQAWLGWNRCLQHISVPHLRSTSSWEGQPGVNGWENSCRTLSPGWGWATLQHPWHTLVSSAGLNSGFKKPQRNSHPWGAPQAEEAQGAPSCSVHRSEKWGLHLCSKAKQDSSLHVTTTLTPGPNFGF